MSDVKCIACGSTDHISGYGLAAGPMGAYTFCNDCNVLLEFTPDLEGLGDEEVERIQSYYQEWLDAGPYCTTTQQGSRDE